MKHIKLFEGYKDDISYIKDMVSDIEDDYEWTTEVDYIHSDINGNQSAEASNDDKNVKIFIKFQMTNTALQVSIGHDVLDLNTIMDKTKQILSQLSGYEIDSISLHYFTNHGESFDVDRPFSKGTSSTLLMKKLDSKNANIARLKGYTSSDKLENIDKYYNLNFFSIDVCISKKSEKSSGIKKFFNYFKN